MLWARALLIIGRIAYQMRKNGVASARANVRKNRASATKAQRSRDRAGAVCVTPIEARIKAHTPRYSVCPLKTFVPEYRSLRPENCGRKVSISSAGGIAHDVACSHPLEDP